MIRNLLCLAILFGFASQAWAGAETLKVRVLSRHPAAEAEISGSALRGKAREFPAGLSGDSLRLSVSGQGLAISGRPAGAWVEFSAQGPIGVRLPEGARRSFDGKLRVEHREGRLVFLNILSMEDYVRSVLPAEMPQDFPLEAQKAQAVLARSYAAGNRGRHAAEGFDLCDLTHCQVYAGAGPLSDKQQEAWRATRGRVLLWQAAPIAALFHSTCGGHTSPNQRVFGGRALPYLQGQSDGDYCAASPHAHWEAGLSFETIEAFLGGEAGRGPLRSVSPSDREPGGRSFTVALVRQYREEMPTMLFLSRAGTELGWNRLKSNWFEVENKQGEAHFRGRGLGHGVGLCQWGAKGRAEAGMKFPEILKSYFPGTSLERWP